MKRLTVIQDMLCYALFYVLDLCTLYKKQAERGCFFNIPFHRLIPKSNGEQKTEG
jgi:hypothetical protein